MIKPLVLWALLGAFAPTVAIGTPDAFPAEATKEEPASRLAVRLGQVADGFAEARGFSGTIVVSRHGQVVFSRAYGLADEGWAIPNTLDTRFRIASMTKAFTALAVLKLHEQGRWDLDAPVSDLLPGIDSRITARHLLLHRAGLARDPTDVSGKDARASFSLAEIVAIASHTPLASEPGVEYAYSNLGYSVLAAAIERASGQPYADAVKTLVLQPLGLAETENEPAHHPLRRLARGYFLLPDGVADAAFEDKSHVLGAGSLVSSAGDLIRFLDTLQASPAFSAETKSLFLDASAKNRTLGLVTWDYKVGPSSPLQPREGRVVMHSGSCPGYESSFGRFLDHGISIVVLGNRSPVPTGSLFNALGNVALGFEAPPPPAPMLAFHRELLAVGPEAMAARLAATPSEQVPAESELNRMGYNLLGVGRAGDAITVFRFNTLLHPDSSNAHDSLGEALLAQGKLDQALASYRRELELAPGSASAQRAVHTIEERLAGE